MMAHHYLSEMKTEIPTDKYKFQAVIGIAVLYLPSLEKKSTLCYSIILLKGLTDFTFQKLHSSLPGCKSSRNIFDVSPNCTFITCSFPGSIVERQVKCPVAGRLIG